MSLKINHDRIALAVLLTDTHGTDFLKVLELVTKE